MSDICDLIYNEFVLTLSYGRPEDPLRVLGEFLIQKSRELEGI